MKSKILEALLLMATGVFILAGTPAAVFAAESPGSSKILVAYFSWSGNTRQIAEMVHERVGGDLVELRVVNPYPTEYRACTDQAKAEQNENARPALATEIADMSSYDTVFIGYPNWWGTIPMALFTFFEQYDFSGKRIIPFCTNEGSGLGRSTRDIAALCPEAALLEGLAVRGGSVGSAADDVASWIDRIGLSN